MRKKIHDYVRGKREALGISVDEMAAGCLMSKSEYLDVESYENELFDVVSLEKIRLIANAIEVDTCDLFGVKRVEMDLEKSFVGTRILDRGISITAVSDYVGIEEVCVKDVAEDILNIGSWVLTPILSLAEVLKMDVGLLLVKYSTRKGGQTPQAEPVS